MFLNLKRILGVFTAGILLLSLLASQPAPVRAAATVSQSVSRQQIRNIVESRTRAIADAIYTSDSDNEAALALATHGMVGGGSKFSVGETHVLTATLWNSEMFQAALVDTCSGAIEYMQLLGLAYLPYVEAEMNWAGAKSLYYGSVHFASEETGFNRNHSLCREIPYTGSRNSFDASLEWIAGGTDLDLDITRIASTAGEATYEVICTVSDRFDFDTSTNAGFKKLISGLGALMFREFDWEASLTFEVTVPIHCSHSTDSYRWTYDPDSQTLTSHTTGDFRENRTEAYPVTNSKGETHSYYRLEKTVRLNPDKPWVMEYTVRNPKYFVITPLATQSIVQPYLMVYGLNYLFIQHRQPIEEQVLYSCYGTALQNLPPQYTYTFRLENVPGTGMVYLTVTCLENQTVYIDRVPMDDLYENAAGVLTLQDSASTGLQDRSLSINYIGNPVYPLQAEFFELTVWENGTADRDDFFCETVTKPSCTAQGYTTHTCSLCGYSFTDTPVPAMGHSFGDWVTEKNSTCTESGYQRRSCSRCYGFEVSEIPATGHSFSQWKVVKNPTYEAPGERLRNCHTCGFVEREEIPKLEILPGDVNGDRSINGRDLILLRQFIAGWTVSPDAAAADCNGDGSINGRDLILLRQFIAGWNVELG